MVLMLAEVLTELVFVDYINFSGPWFKHGVRAVQASEYFSV